MRLSITRPPNGFTISRERRERQHSLTPHLDAPLVGCSVLLGGLLYKGVSPRIGYRVGSATVENLDEWFESILSVICSFAFSDADQLHEFDSAKLQLETLL
jgi:hypothetical protein